MIHNHHLSIPIELISFAIQKEIGLKALRLFLYLKLTTPGKFKVNECLLIQAQEALKIKTDRTFKKYLQVLLNLGWLYYSHKKRVIFVKSFDKIREELNLTKQNAILFTLKDCETFHEYITGAIITNNIRKQVWASRRKHKSDSAYINSDNAQLPVKNYYGMSNLGISKLLNCGQTRACVLKNKAEIAGYITTDEKMLKVYSLPAEKNMRAALRNLYPNLYHRCRIQKSADRLKSFKRSSHVDIMLQLHDEIRSKMKITKRRRISSKEI